MTAKRGGRPLYTLSEEVESAVMAGNASMRGLRGYGRWLASQGHDR
jgi:hypothetical protein